MIIGTGVQILSALRPKPGGELPKPGGATSEMYTHAAINTFKKGKNPLDELTI